MRTFIAIELSSKIKEYLSRLQDRLKTSQADVKWVSPSNIHLTLKFLGEIDDNTMEQTKRLIEDTAGVSKRFSLRLADIGAFPSLRSPRVIWIGIDKGDEEVRTIAKILEEKLSSIGISKEDREFSSHITLGRTRSSKNRNNLVQVLESLKAKPQEGIVEMPVDKITLYKSTLTPRGPIYEVIKETCLLNSK